jgi:hypothetical protein
VAAHAWEVCFGLEGDVPMCLIFLIYLIAFVSILYLIDFFFLFGWGLVSGSGTSMRLACFCWGLRSFVLCDKWSRIVGYSDRHLVKIL